MWRRLATGVVLALLAACEDKLLTAPKGQLDPTAGDGTPGEDDEPDAGGVVLTGPWGDPATTHKAGTLRLGQFNVRRYFDATCDSGSCSQTGFEEAPTAAAFASKTAKLAAGVARLEADVITLAEVENQACLDALKAKLKESGIDYPIAYVAETGAAGSIDVAVLSRGTLGTVKNHKDDSPLVRPDGSKTSFTRELPEVHISFGGKQVIVFAAHFRSKSGTDDPGRRLAEAQKAHEIMVAVGTANASALTLLGGDLNDTPGSPPLDALESDGALLRVAKDVPESQQGTYTFNNENQAIDHIFTTASRTSAYVAKSANAVRDGATGGLGSSDHAALYADFTLP